jgi:muramidase (phage lysozyme)
MTTTVTSPRGKVLHHRATMTTTPKESAEAKEVRIQLKLTKRLEENKEYLKNANVKAFLAMIGKSEGGDYHAKYGWRPGSSKWTFTDESTHPGPGSDGVTTASGLYQINNVCWREHGIKSQGLKDFSPATQDLIAVDNIRAHNALQPIIDGDVKTAIGILKPNQWTSFQVHSYDDLVNWYKEAGGTVK